MVDVLGHEAVALALEIEDAAAHLVLDELVLPPVLQLFHLEAGAHGRLAPAQLPEEELGLLVEAEQRGQVLVAAQGPPPPSISGG